MTNRQATSSGSLYVVATPIGNLEDISLRALNILKSVDFIIAEDTRHSGALLSHFAIKKPLTSLHAFNEETKSRQIIALLAQGQSAALISDAGTPLISDPGFSLVKWAREEEISVIPIPGACAFITALSASGIPCDHFTFAGFMPAKRSARREKLKQLSASTPHTLVFYESTHRILAFIHDIGEIFGEDCDIMLAKELTKTYERFVYGHEKDILLWLNSEPAHQKGEFVVIIPPRQEKTQSREQESTLMLLLKELPLKQAVKITAEITGANKNELYKQALALQLK